jgi:hypothetical protein
VDLNDYDDEPPKVDDPYAPRPKASQAAAAAHRARYGSAPAAPVAKPAPFSVPIAAGALVIILLMVGMISYQLSLESARPIQITPAATMLPSSAPAIVPTVRATSAPTAAPVAMLPAYDSPNGALLGQIEVTRSMTPVAHYGADWIQADVEGSGRVWLRASDWPALVLMGPDLAR